MKNASAHSPVLENAVTPSDENRFAAPDPANLNWPWRKIFFLVVLAVVAHVALIKFFGTHKQIVPRPVANVPHLQLANEADQFIALANPTLFALPNPRDFASVIWLKVPAVTPPSFRWNEPPQWLPLDTGNPGAAFQQFLPSPGVPEIQLNVKPPPELSVPSVSLGGALPQSSTLKIIGELAQRVLLNPVVLPSLPYNNVIPPSKIQVLVSPTGTVISAILLPLTDSLEAVERCDPADQRALELARRLRFAPARQLAFGEIIFQWHTVPGPLNQPQTSP